MGKSDGRDCVYSQGRQACQMRWLWWYIEDIARIFISIAMALVVQIYAASGA